MIALALLRRFWPALAIGALVICGYLYIQHVDRTARAEQKAADAAVVKQAQLEAKAKDLEKARAVEAARATATKDANDALFPELEAARAGLADYARRLRNQAAQGGGGGAGLPGAASGADVADGSDPPPLLDDLDRCTEAVTRLRNAQEWWSTTTKQEGKP